MAKTKRTRNIRGHFDRQRVTLECPQPSRAKQSFKDQCDINVIMAKFQKTGVITHVNKREPEYGFASSNDLKESLKIVENAQQMFDELPSKIRKKFDNNPALFLDFVQDEANVPEAALLGLLSEEATLAQAQAVKDALASSESDSEHSPSPPGDKSSGGE